MSWRLDSAEVRAERHTHFEIPSREEREGLVVGDFAKLVFMEDVPPAGERMWVEVSEVLAGVYIGVTVNTPAVVNVPEGTVVTFAPEHIIDIERGGTLAAVFAREEREGGSVGSG